MLLATKHVYESYRNVAWSFILDSNISPAPRALLHEFSFCKLGQFLPLVLKPEISQKINPIWPGGGGGGGGGADMPKSSLIKGKKHLFQTAMSPKGLGYLN